MHFEKDRLYHLYNQGNNRQKLFFKRDNYLFFQQKIKTHILPFADVVAWCLMPNHFHLMIRVREVEITSQVGTHQVTPSHQVSKTKGKSQSLNQSIAVLLRSYTRAINKQNDSSGSLFRQKTKAKCINCPKDVSPNYFMNNGVTQINISDPMRQYPQVCFEYIHDNPLKAGMVNDVVDWEFSSARDYFGDRDGLLVDKKVAVELGLLPICYSPGDSESSGG